MSRYAVSLPGFKFTAFKQEDGSATLKGPGNPFLAGTWEMEANSEPDAVHAFKKQLGIIKTMREFTVKNMSEPSDHEPDAEGDGD